MANDDYFDEEFTLDESISGYQVVGINPEKYELLIDCTRYPWL